METSRKRVAVPKTRLFLLFAGLAAAILLAILSVRHRRHIAALENSVPHQLKMLTHGEDEATRYWGARRLGYLCLKQGGNAGDVVAALTRAAICDESDMVAETCVWALRAIDDPKGVSEQPILEEALTSGDPKRRERAQTVISEVVEGVPRP